MDGRAPRLLVLLLWLTGAICVQGCGGGGGAPTIAGSGGGTSSGAGTGGTQNAGGSGTSGGGSSGGVGATGGATGGAGGRGSGGFTSGAAGGQRGGGGAGATGGVRGSGGAGVTGGSPGGGGGMGGAAAVSCGAGGSGPLGGLPKQADVLALMRLANAYFVQKWPDPTVNISGGHPSNIWTRAVYYEGLMGLYGVESDATRKQAYYDYAVTWGASPTHPWQLAYGGTTTRDANDQCCGQTYLDLDAIDAQAVRVADITADIQGMVSSSASGDWTWVDAIQMSMPVFAKLGVLDGDTATFAKMHALYDGTRTTQGLYNATDGLWWRDATFKPPFMTPNGKPCYWSRGNGWVFAALARTLDIIPATAVGRAEYLADFTAMASALGKLQRLDGFWNVSLVDPDDHGGPELTGTALFTYGMALGVREGLLDGNVYGPILGKAWCALASAIHTSGALGYAQGSGSKPADGQPVTFDSVPDYIDFPLGCILLGASEVSKIASP
jgi:unsaturated rhamnogalacturonyl hydrolase